MEEYKRIATTQLLEIVGEVWLNNSKDNISIFTCDEGIMVRIVFCLISMLPSEQQVINNNNTDFQPEGSISFIIDKKTKNCRLYKNLLQK